MRVFCVLCGLFLAIALVNGGPVVKREAEEDLSPLNEVSTLFYLVLKKKKKKEKKKRKKKKRRNRKIIYSRDIMCQIKRPLVARVTSL